MADVSCSDKYQRREVQVIVVHTYLLCPPQHRWVLWDHEERGRFRVQRLTIERVHGPYQIQLAVLLPLHLYPHHRRRVAR